MCRSRRELFNAYLLAKIGVDTAENEPLEVWGGKFNSLFTSLLRVATKDGLLGFQESPFTSFFAARVETRPIFCSLGCRYAGNL